MKIEKNGWWFPVKVTVTIPINNINQAEFLRDQLDKMGQFSQSDKLKAHIKEQEEHKFLTRESYMDSDWTPDLDSVFKMIDEDPVKINFGEKQEESFIKQLQGENNADEN